MRASMRSRLRASGRPRAISADGSPPGACGDWSRNLESRAPFDLIVSTLPLADEVTVLAGAPRHWCRIANTLSAEIEHLRATDPHKEASGASPGTAAVRSAESDRRIRRRRVRSARHARTSTRAHRTHLQPVRFRRDPQPRGRPGASARRALRDPRRALCRAETPRSAARCLEGDREPAASGAALLPRTSGWRR